MVYRVKITGITFLSKSTILLLMRRGDEKLHGTCEIPWVVRMFHWMTDSGVIIKKTGQKKEVWHDIPAIVNMTSGMIVEDMDLLLDQEFPGREILTTWMVMES